MNNSGLTVTVVCVQRVFFVLFCCGSLKSFLSGRYANGEVASAPAVNGTSRLRCTNRRQGQTSGGSGGYLSLLSQESWQRR